MAKSKKTPVKKVKKPKVVREYLGYPIDSDGEVHFIMWMEELKQNGFIKDYKRGETIVLSNPVTNTYTSQLKTKSKVNNQNILMSHSYSWDFTIEWTDLGIKHFVNKFGEKWEKPFIINSESTSFVECKPPFDFQNMSRLATLNIKWVWEKYKIFIQLVKNIELFEKTFTPKAYLVTKNGKNRKLQHNVRTLEEYLQLL